MIYSPTSDNRYRYKVKINGDDAACRNIIRDIGPICGRPFKSVDSRFQRAFYVYGNSESVKERISDVLGKFFKDEESSEPTAERNLPRPEEKPLPPPPPRVFRSVPLEEHKPKSVDFFSKYNISELNPDYTFENLYVGGFNRFLKEACESIATEFDKSYNPLFIWGDVGLGKTHLMQAIGNFIMKHKKGTVVYVPAQDLKTAIQKVLDIPSEKAELVEFFSSASALLIDDIQFLEGDATQEIFFSIFEKSYNKQHQIVITADRSPKHLSQIADRLRSRFEWGLVSKILKPDMDSRIGILKLKIAKEFQALELTGEMLKYIAKEFEDNIRELEGVLKKLNIYYQFKKGEISLEMLKDVVTELKGEEVPVSSQEKPSAEKAALPPTPPTDASISPAKHSEKAETPPAPEDFPPPPPEAQCPYCGGELSYIEMYDRWYCYSCKRYAPPDFGKGKFAKFVKKKKTSKDEFEKMKALEELKKLAEPPRKEEPIKVIKKEDVKVVEEKKEQKPPAKPASVPPLKITRKIQCAVFYPAKREKELGFVVDYVKKTITKHHLHVDFDFIVQQEYNPQKVNYSAFVNILSTAKIRVALVIGPPVGSAVSDDEFYETLNRMFADAGFCLEYIGLSEIRQTYEYLNIVLDIANFGKQKLGYRILKEEFHGDNIKKG